MESSKIRKKFLDFFEKRGHAVIPSSPLVPESDPSVLFTTAGMQQFKQYYTGAGDAKKDFGSLNTVSIQKCVRTSDIEKVGDESHLTFFEMLGNFSFGGYFKKEAIEYGHEFITKEMSLKIDYVSVFGGNGNIAADEESEKIWKSISPEIDIRRAGKKDNFWGPTGDEGPCGPTTEIYVNGVEVWNIVFNEYYQNKDETLQKLETPGVDTGMGLERLAVVVQKKDNIFDIDLFSSVVQKIRGLAKNKNLKAERIVADHIRAAVFMVADSVLPSNADRGYILRRILRRAIKYSDNLQLSENALLTVANMIVEKYRNIYSEVGNIQVKDTIALEEKKFKETLKQGIKEFEKGERNAFVLFSTYGFPLEMTLELAKENGVSIDTNQFDEEFKKHQELSRTTSGGMFRGGLADHKEKTIKLHTAHHLLLAALQDVLGKEVKQRGSNITEERLRMDFSYPRKLNTEEIKKVEEIVNQRIKEGLMVNRREMPKIEAETLGAEMEFGAKYPDVVSIYFIEDEKGDVISKEFCGGPHVANTRELGVFRIAKEEAVSAGVRRIKATLE